MGNTSYWSVKPPQAGEDYNREQAWAALEKERTTLDHVAQSIKSDGFNHDKRSPLSKEEGEELAAIRSRLRALTEKLNRNALEELAAIPPTESPFPADIAAFLDGYHGDFSRFCRDHKESEILLLGFAVLQAGGFENDRITELLAKVENTQYRKYGKVFVCPRCDRYGEKGKKECKLCFGWGYVLREKEPEAEDYDLSDAGKIAANEGQEWTPEQEKAAQREQNGEDE
jgi:hypothetical protein